MLEIRQLPLNPENPEDQERSSDKDSPRNQGRSRQDGPENADSPPPQDGHDQDSPSPHESALYEIEEALKQDPQNKDLLMEATRIYHRLAMQGNEASLDMADESVKALLKLDEYIELTIAQFAQERFIGCRIGSQPALFTG